MVSNSDKMFEIAEDFVTEKKAESKIITKRNLIIMGIIFAVAVFGLIIPIIF